MGKKKKKTTTKKRERGLTEYGKYRKIVYLDPDENFALRRKALEENVPISTIFRAALRKHLGMPPLEE